MSFGLIGVWIAMFIDWVVRCIFFIWRYYIPGIICICAKLLETALAAIE